MDEKKTIFLKDVAIISIGKNLVRDNVSVEDNELYTYENFNNDLNEIAIFDDMNTRLLVKNRVAVNDIIFNLTTKKAALVSMKNNNRVVGQNFVIVYPKKIDKLYLLYLLNDDIGMKKQIESLNEGSFNKRISVKNLAELSIEVVNDQVQVAMGRIYLEMIKQKNKLIRQAALIEKATVTLLNESKRRKQ